MIHVPQLLADPSTDPALDVLRAGRKPLDAFFAPRAVALIGATDKPGSVGRTILANLIASPFGGTVYPVNPKRRSVLGIATLPDIGSAPEPVDLAIIVTPPPSIPGLVDDCGLAGVPAVIVISAGFKEIGAEGAELERQVAAAARRHQLRLIGPNCLGVMSPVSGLNATFAAAMAPRGRVAFLSQSGALVTAVLDWALREKVGFSSIVSLGSMADVGWGDLIDHLGNDRETDAIVMYMETVGDARSFLSAAREVALTKPIIVMKPGRTTEAAKAAASHTGSLAGSDEVLAAAFRRAGVLRAERISDLFYLAEVLGKQPRPRGPRLTVVTNAGGPGVLATDALIDGGGKLAALSAETMAALDAVLPPTWSHGNPIDIIGDAPPERYAAALEIAAAGPRQRWPSGHPDPAGDDRPDDHSAAAGAVREGHGQARDGQLDGRPGRGGRDGRAARGGHRHLPLPRQRRAHVHPAVDVAAGPGRALRDAQPPGRRGTCHPSRPGRRAHRDSPRGGPHHPR